MSDSSAQPPSPEPVLVNSNANSETLASSEATAGGGGGGAATASTAASATGIGAVSGRGESPGVISKRFGFIQVFSRAHRRQKRHGSQEVPDQQSPQKLSAASNPAPSSNTASSSKQRYASAQTAASASTADSGASFRDESYENLSYEVTADDDPEEQLLKEWEVRAAYDELV